MNALKEVPVSESGLSSRNFRRLAEFIYNYSGIKMPDAKKVMLEGRLRRRLRVTGFVDFDSYCDYLFEGDGLEAEALHLIDVVTTNKTDFFREPSHFDFLQANALPELMKRGLRRLRVWSAACSIGAEPYTLAMVIDDFLRDQKGQDYRILATDLSTEVLQKAQRGIYPADAVEPVPASLAARYVLVARDRNRGEVRIAPHLRSHVAFARLNLMDDSYSVGEPMDVIFCRNVLIYFDKKTQYAVLSRLCDCLDKGGYLFIGHSESIAGMNLPLKQVANTIFIKG